MTTIDSALQLLHLPQPDSHKGQNGKVMLIGGSELFHAASKWSLDVMSKFVDMVFYSSVPENNQLIHKAKAGFWNGIVIRREELENYIGEADAVLIGPGMTRETETAELANRLLKAYPHKKWVIDAGALQMVDPQLFSERVVITPHPRELEMVLKNAQLSPSTNLQQICTQLNGVVIVLKGKIDQVSSSTETVSVSGGDPGMTKGGTGDVLAGLIAALYATNDIFTAAVVGSYVNKKAGELLAKKVGPFFNASDLVEAIPEALWESLQLLRKLG